MSNLPLPAKLPFPTPSASPIPSEDIPLGLTPPLLMGVTEGLKAGVLIVALSGTILHANRYAQKICQQLLPQSGRSLTLPKPISRLVQALIESHDLFPEYDLILEDEIQTATGTTLQIKARWLETAPAAAPNVLITLAACYQRWPSSHPLVGI